ncbi:hypothetical protein QTP70_007092 [Hemibagrus guttatus]|uniref:Alkylated DNA repair protein AlkB homologue 8 N-terminal domain-containing protein n=1 Tax=Hemibagrus guttatus TaxID=175788 RepID=A0AAE0RIL3_9TELE|nr:hypothetical protein QTP70_007092 [Hemibagrus guttatus]KAK3574299.1 hypothetical protein QTP86_004353 [Hemibagrus guttatus]
MLFIPLTHNCVALHTTNHIVMFTKYMTVVGLSARTMQQLRAWWRAINLSLNVNKTKEIADFTRAESDHFPLNIDGSSMLIVKITKFLYFHLVENHTWSLNTSSISKKSQQGLYFL